MIRHLSGAASEELVASIAGVGQEIAAIEHEARPPLNLPPQSMIPSLNTRSLQFSYRLDELHLPDSARQGGVRPHLMDRPLVCPRCERYRAFVTAARVVARAASSRSRSFTTLPAQTSGASKRSRRATGWPVPSAASGIFRSEPTLNTNRDRTVVTFECRKHLDLSFFWYANFCWPNFGMMLERWFFNVVCVYTFWSDAYWLAFVFSGDLLKLLILLYLMQIGLETGQFLLLLC